MPNRYIRESAIESEGVNSLSWQGEVFYRRLLNRVDDFGRCTATLPLLRAAIFPLQLDKVREVDISRLLLECEQAGLLFRYTAESKATLVLNRWEQGRAKESKYPSPPADLCQRMQTYVYTSKHKSTTPTPTPTPTPNADTDTDNKPVLPDALSTDGFRAKWAEYEAYRRTTGMRALRSVSVAKKWTEMAAWGHDAAIASIEATIKNGWQGIFEPKGPAGGSQPARLDPEFDQF